MSTANRRRRAMRRNPTRFMLDNILSDGPFLQELRRRALKSEGAIATFGKKPGEIRLGVDVGTEEPWNSVVYLDYEGVHIVR